MREGKEEEGIGEGAGWERGREGGEKVRGGRGDGDWGPTLHIIKTDKKMKVNKTHPKDADFHLFF